MYSKTINSSKRGLTFSFKHKKLRIGDNYKYLIIHKSNKIFIIKSSNKNDLIVSKKKVGLKEKALIDIRNKKIKKTLHPHNNLNIIFKNNVIVITLNQSYKEIKKLFINNKIKVSSLFSGCGMFDYPFHLDHKFKLIFAVDVLKDACKSYKENIGDHILCENIKNININEIPKSNVIIGGVPCTPFSNANRSTKRLMKHDDCDLALEFIRIVHEGECEVFVLENVPSFIKVCDGYYLDSIKECLSQYEIETKILKDCDYGGFTTRKRVFIIGSQIGKPIFPEPTVKNYKTVKEALDKVTDNWYNYNDITKCKESSIEKMKYIPQGGNFKYIPQEIRGKGNHSNRYKRLKLDEPSCTLTNFRKSKILHPLKNRILSVAEALALSGFKKTFKVLGTLSNKQQQVGNGVPFYLGTTIKNIVKDIFMRANFELT